eukprot:Nk52_evm25s280 gene=Nk52_evmTU25s280
MDRKAELEKKKKKLEDLRRAREARKAAANQNLAQKINPAASRENEREEVNQLLSNLIGDETVLPVKTSADTGDAASVSDSQEKEKDSSPAVVYQEKPKPVLSFSEPFCVNIPPKEKVVYTKECQTEASITGLPPPLEEVNEEEDEKKGLDKGREGTSTGGEEELEIESVEVVTLPPETAAQPPQLTELQKDNIMNSDTFGKFFERASRLIERALNEEYDVTIDYEHRDSDLKEGLKTLDSLQCITTFADTKWSRGRAVTSLDWSIKHPELCLASYNDNPDVLNEPDGTVAVWNMHLPGRPEYAFQCQSAVVSSCFAQFHPNLILGGTYAGQVVLWDNRAKNTPVQRTPLSSDYHTHPVYGLEVVGTQNAHNLVSISTEGKMCTWTLDMLSEPQDVLELQHKQNKAVSSTCMSFAEGETNKFIVGSEDGGVFSAHRLGSKRGISDSLGYHYGPVTGVSVHPPQGAVDYSDLVLSSSIDWSVKLWSQKSQQCLFSFEDAVDYVCDVQWSPTHPSVFAAVDGMKRLTLWNINQDTEVPSAVANVETKVALNKLKWAPGGSRICVGDALGSVFVYDVDETFKSAHNDDWGKLGTTLLAMKAEADASGAIESSR